MSSKDIQRGYYWTLGAPTQFPPYSWAPCDQNNHVLGSLLNKG